MTTEQQEILQQALTRLDRAVASLALVLDQLNREGVDCSKETAEWILDRGIERKRAA